MGRPLFRSGFRFHFLGFWVCALLFTSRAALGVRSLTALALVGTSDSSDITHQRSQSTFLERIIPAFGVHKATKFPTRPGDEKSVNSALSFVSVRESSSDNWNWALSSLFQRAHSLSLSHFQKQKNFSLFLFVLSLLRAYVPIVQHNEAN